MARIQFLSTNLWSALTSTVVADSAVANLPASASQNPDRSYVWRSLTSANQVGTSPYAHSTLDIDLGSVLPVSIVALANVRLLAPDAELTLYQRGDGATAGSAVLVGTLPAADTETNVTYLAFASQSHRHWQLRWTNEIGHLGYVEAGYVFLGVPFEPSVNYTAPSAGQITDPSIAVKSVDGQTTITDRSQFAAKTLVFTDLGQSDFNTLRAMYRTVGVRRNFFLILDTTQTWTAQLVRFVSPLSYEEADVYGRYNVSVSYEEAL